MKRKKLSQKSHPDLSYLKTEAPKRTPFCSDCDDGKRCFEETGLICEKDPYVADY